MLKYCFRFKFRKVIIFILVILLYFSLSQVFYQNHENQLHTILWWTPFMAEDEKFIKCAPNISCKVTKNRTFINDSNLAAFLFYGSDFEPSDLPPLPKQKIWGIYHEESPRNLAIFLHNFTQSIFDFSATFSRFSDFPVTLQYLENFSSITNKRYYIDIKQKNKFLKELSPILYIQSNCDTPSERDSYIRELMKYINVDSYGDCLKNKKIPPELNNIHPLDLYNEKLMHFVGKYKFTIAFENAICDDYITEKLWRPLIAGSVPIYFGAPTITDWLPNQKSAILVKNYKSPQLLAEFLKKLNENDDLYNNYLEHKLGNQISNQFLKQFQIGLSVQEFECFICKETYKSVGKPQIKSNIYKCAKPSNSWINHWDIGQCQSKAFEYFLKKGQNFTKDSFNKLWMDFFDNNNC